MHPDHVVDRAVRLYVEGRSTMEVAAIMGTHNSNVRRWVYSAGKASRPGCRRK